MKHSTRQILQQHNLAPHKRFGQNFLVNPNIPEQIAHIGEISPDDTIIEVGVGLGALTIAIAKRAKHVIGVEIDSGFIRYHDEEKILPENVTLVHQDILKTDFAQLRKRTAAPLKIMANLPYSISNPFIFKLIEYSDCIDWAIIMLQKEVADRLLAKPSTKEYGIPTVLLSSCATVDKKMTLKPHEFHPQPKVDSIIVRMNFSPVPSHLSDLSRLDRIMFQHIVRAAFSQRRKTLLNNLSHGGILGDVEEKSKKDIREISEKIIHSAGISPSIRAENLGLDEFLDLTAAYLRWFAERTS